MPKESNRSVRQPSAGVVDFDRNLTSFANGGDPACWLAKLCPPKLPHRTHDSIVLVTIESADELHYSLLIHDGMTKDHWTHERGHVPSPRTHRFGSMAALGLAREYFGQNWRDTHILLFREWKSETTLSNCIETTSRPLVEVTR